MRHRQQYVRQSVLIGLLLLVISSCLTFLFLYSFMPRPMAHIVAPYEDIASSDTPVVKPEVSSPPVQLNIDSIGVAAAIKPAGLTSAGDMDIDESPVDLAWYKFGPKPGQIGSAVVAGHYGWKNNVPSIFNDLNKLIEGDEVLVHDQNGEVKRFVVTKTALYDPNQDATDVFTSHDGKAHLNLITCQGSWVDAEQTYSKRLIVFTNLINQ